MIKAKQSKKYHLDLKLYPELPVFQDGVLKTLHSLINQHLPQWSTELQVTEDDYSRGGVKVGRDGDLSQGIQQAAPLRHGFGVGSAILKGAYKGLTIYLDHCNETLPPNLNYISVELYRLAAVEDHTPPEWAWSFFEALVSVLPVRYGRANLDAEFRAKNLIDDTEGLRAVGVKLDVALPGLYWLNHFGAPYLKLIGKDRLLSAPVYQAKGAGEGVLIALDASPLSWESTAYREREQQAIGHIGPQFFFSKGDPERRTVAPDFRSEHLSRVGGPKG
jgi:hypothetical protein